MILTIDNKQKDDIIKSLKLVNLNVCGGHGDSVT